MTVPVPVNTCPLQQNWNAPVCESNCKTIFGFESSCKQVSNAPGKVAVAPRKKNPAKKMLSSSDGLVVFTVTLVAPDVTNGARLYNSSSKRGSPFGGSFGLRGFAFESPMPPTVSSAPSSG